MAEFHENTCAGLETRLVATFGFDANKDQTYTLEITNTATNAVLYRDKLFVTDQSASTYSINTGKYTFETSSTNDYLVYE